MRIIFSVIIIIFTSYMPAKAYADKMTIEQAYRALDKHHMKFDLRSARMPKEDAKYLDHMFFVIDLAMRERMVMLKYALANRSDKYIEEYNKEIDNLLMSFDLITAPTTRLKKAERLTIEIINEQHEFFNEWNEKIGTPYYILTSQNYRSNELVQSNHKKLLELYGLLLRTYRTEENYNRKAFYNYLCALDFI